MFCVTIAIIINESLKECEYVKIQVNAYFCFSPMLFIEFSSPLTVFKLNIHSLKA